MADLEVKNTHIEIKTKMTQKDLEELARSEDGIAATSIKMAPEYGPSINLNKVSFPNLETLSIYDQDIMSLNMSAENYPKLKSFSLSLGGCGKVMCISFNLPELETMNLWHVSFLSVKGLGESLSRSPKLKSFESYKLFGVSNGGPPLTFVLPNCESLAFHRADEPERMRIWAPKLQYLNLRASSFKEINMMKKKPKGYESAAYDFNGTPSGYKVNCINLDHPKGNVLTHERCIGVENTSADLETTLEIKADDPCVLQI